MSTLDDWALMGRKAVMAEPFVNKSVQISQKKSNWNLEFGNFICLK